MWKCFSSKNQVWVISLLLFEGMGSIFLAKDFWQEKPFSQWSESEAMMLLSNSPWAKIQPIKGDYGGAFIPRQIDASSAASSPTINPAQGYDENSTVLYIRWHSSLKVRQAIGRLGWLRKAYTEDMLRQFIDQEMPDIVISIAGSKLEPFEKLTFEEARPKTLLLSKKDKNKKVSLKLFVRPKETQDGSALFLFPRQLESNPSVDPADEEIYFVTQVGKTKIRVVFKLAAMMVAGKLDI